MKLYAGDTLQGTTDKAHGDFSVPATAGTYRLDYDVDASKALPISTKTSTEWTFHSNPVEERLPLLLVDRPPTPAEARSTRPSSAPTSAPDPTRRTALLPGGGPPPFRTWSPAT
jgi:hypothetical protein